VRIAIRAPNWLGDAVMSLPAVRDLRATFPEAGIDCYASAAAAEIYARGVSDVNVVSLPSGRGTAFRRVVPMLLRGRYDLGVILPPSFSSALLFALGGVRNRIGYRSDARAPLLTVGVERARRGSVHLAEEFRHLCRLAAERQGRTLANGDASEAFAISDGERERVAGLLSGRTRPWVALAPGAIYGRTKRWPASRFADLAARLQERHAAEIILTGSARDREACHAVEAAMTASVVNLAGRTDVGTAAALLAEMDLVVSNDSGAMHLAAAVGAPVVAIFGSTNSDWTSPIGSRVRIVRREEPCAPCYADDCEIGIVCLERITSDEVYSACRPFLDPE